MKKDFFVGADVSKDKLDICFLTSNTSVKPKFISLPNDYETIKAYFKSFINHFIAKNRPNKSLSKTPLFRYKSVRIIDLCLLF